MPKTNITFSVDSESLGNAKAYAARAGVPLNRIVGQMFAALGQRQAAGAAISAGHRQVLRYSLGQASLYETVQALGVNDGGVVHAMLRELGLPFPFMDSDAARQMAQEALPALRAALLAAAPRKAARRR